MRTTSGMHKTFLEYHQAYDHRMNAWKQEVLFTWQWWFGVLITIIVWVLWLFFRNRDSSDRLLYAGLFVCLASLTLDNTGIQLSLWTYLKPFTPVIPAYIPFDFALMPVTIMFIIQYFSKRNPWIVGFIFGLISALIGEPIFKLMGIYDPVNWKSWYSIPLYTVIYVISHKLTLRDKFKQLI